MHKCGLRVSEVTHGGVDPTVRQSVMHDAVKDIFAAQFGDTHGLRVVMAPGRVNLLGEHTDYNDGFVLPMTIDRGVYVACRARRDDRVQLYSRRFDERVDYRLDEPPATEPGAWSCYVIGVVEALRARGYLDRGIDAVVDGDLDPGAGLSSSAALEVAVTLALEQAAGFELDAVETAKLCQQVEHRYAHVMCGIMDQFVSRLGRRDRALYLDCRSLEYRHVPLELGEYRIVIIASGVSRALAASEYNDRRAECQQALDYFKSVEPGVSALRDISDAMLAEHQHALDPVPLRRCRHVVTENRRVVEAVSRLDAGDLPAFGRLVSESHHSLRDDYEVSCAELDWLVDLANDTEGVLGSRMTGAGFGGCTVNLVHKESFHRLSTRIDADYGDRFGSRAKTWLLETNLEAGLVA